MRCGHCAHTRRHSPRPTGVRLQSAADEGEQEFERDPNPDDESEAKILGSAVANLDAWLDTMRSPDGYGGPVAHWWQNCLQFTGAGLDWRYEGIIGMHD